MAIPSRILLPLLAAIVFVSPAAAESTTHRLRRTATLPLVLVELTPTDRVWLAIDTGATGTTVIPDVAERLALEITGTATLQTLAGAATVPLVHLPGLRIAGAAAVHDVQAAVHDLTELRRLAPDAEGILGQDVLAAYDYLIDFDRERLVLGTFAPPLRGLGLPLSWSAGRPVVQVQGLSASHGLVLDTGADVLVIEGRASRDALGDTPVAGRSRASLQTHFGSQTVEVEHHGRLQLAGFDLSRVDVVRLPAGLWRQSPEVGLLPAALFGRVYVSARTGRAAVWPKRP